MPTAMHPGNSSRRLTRASGSRTAAVPRMTRDTPSPSQASMVSRLRMPPPSCTGMLTAFRISATATALPASRRRRRRDRRGAATRSPAPRRRGAWAAGSALNTVARSISPWRRRTQLPSLRSMAGNRITAATSGNWRSARGRASGSSRGGIGSRPCCPWRRSAVIGAAIIGARHEPILLLRHEMVGMHEIGMHAAVSGRNAVEQRMVVGDPKRVPAHMRES